MKVTVFNAAQLQHLNKNPVMVKAVQRLKLKKRGSAAAF